MIRPGGRLLAAKLTSASSGRVHVSRFLQRVDMLCFQRAGSQRAGFQCARGDLGEGTGVTLMGTRTPSLAWSQLSVS